MMQFWTYNARQPADLHKPVPFLYKTNTDPAGLSKNEEGSAELSISQSSAVGTRPTVGARITVDGDTGYVETQATLKSM